MLKKFFLISLLFNSLNLLSAEGQQSSPTGDSLDGSVEIVEPSLTPSVEGNQNEGQNANLAASIIDDVDAKFRSDPIITQSQLDIALVNFAREITQLAVQIDTFKNQKVDNQTFQEYCKNLKEINHRFDELNSRINSVFDSTEKSNTKIDNIRNETTALIDSLRSEMQKLHVQMQFAHQQKMVEMANDLKRLQEAQQAQAFQISTLERVQKQQQQQEPSCFDFFRCKKKPVRADEEQV